MSRCSLRRKDKLLQGRVRGAALWYPSALTLCIPFGVELHHVASYNTHMYYSSSYTI